MKSVPLIATFCLFSVLLNAQGSLTATYNNGDIPTHHPNYDAACNGPNTTLTFTLPIGFGDLSVTGIDISYDMTAANGGYMSDQRSQIHFQNLNTTESVVMGTGTGGGTVNYNRTNVSIANGTYAEGTILTFEMRAWRDWGDMETCGVFYNKVDDGTWTVTIHLDCPNGDIVFDSQAKLDEFGTVFNGCDSIFGSLSFTEHGWLPEPSDFTNFQQVTYVAGNLSMIDVETNISSNIEYIGGYLYVNRYENASFNFLQKIMNIGGGIALISNDFTSLNFLNNLSNTSFEFLNISGSFPYDFTVFQNIDSIHSFMYLSSQNGPLNGLENLEYIGENMQLSGFDEPNLNKLSNLTQIGGTLSLNHNTFVSLAGLENINLIDSSINISYNGLLTNLNGLENLNTLGGNLILQSNAMLTDLSALNNLHSIGGNLKIEFNEMLTNVDGLINLNYLAGNLEISDNTQLSNLTGFENLQTIGGQVIIESNSTLSDCCLLYSKYPNITAIPPSFSQNAPGCYNDLDVYQSCFNSIDPDRDGIFSNFDNCPDNYNPDQEDADGDNIGNSCDNCPMIANGNQEDVNGNFIGDACENIEPGKAGINTNTPKSGLEIAQSDLFLNDVARGIIMKSANGNCFRLYIDMDGNLQTKQISCPQ